MVNVTHYGNYGRTENQRLGCILDDRNLGRIYLRRQLLYGNAEGVGYQGCGIEINFLIDGSKNTHKHKLLDNLNGSKAHLAGKILDSDNFAYLDFLRAGDFCLLRRLLNTALVVTALVLAAEVLRSAGIIFIVEAVAALIVTATALIIGLVAVGCVLAAAPLLIAAVVILVTTLAAVAASIILGLLRRLALMTAATIVLTVVAAVILLAAIIVAAAVGTVFTLTVAAVTLTVTAVLLTAAVILIVLVQS